MALRTAPIRYATATRFGVPQQVTTHESSGQICPQPTSRLVNIMGTPADVRPQGEDCLNLSITTPALDRGKRPVMVWLHGGGFSSGAGLLDWYDGSALSDEGDVVVVSVNYRLGVFGYLCVDGMSPGNLGLLDQIEALRWVRSNIARYGGDPDQITVFGQSAGGMSIRLMLDCPERLFQRAILQSAPVAHVTQTHAEAADAGKAFLAHLDDDPFTAEPAKLLAAQVQVAKTSGIGLAVPFRPVALSTGDQDLSGVEVVYGWNTEENTALSSADVQKDFADPLGRFGEWVQQRGGRAFGYRIDWRPEGSPFGATHCVELPLLLGSAASWHGSPMLGSTSWREVDAFGRDLRADWITFVRTGVPGTKSTTKWPVSCLN